MQIDKRYLVFYYSDEHSSGGLRDKVDSFHNMIEVKEYLKKKRPTMSINVDVYDRIKGMKVNLELYVPKHGPQ